MGEGREREADGGVGGRVKLANDVTYKRCVYCWEGSGGGADVGCTG